jgi:hypothetical protein
MTKDVLTALLAKGQTGNQILEILDTIASGGDDSFNPQDAATLEEIQF